MTNSIRPPSPYALELIRRASKLGKENPAGVRLKEYSPNHLYELNAWMKTNQLEWGNFTIGERDAAFSAYLNNTSQ